MTTYTESLLQILDRCEGSFSLSEDERTTVHNAYWNSNLEDIGYALQIICFEPSPLDMPILLDASSPGSLWIHRCDSAEALSGLADGRAVLRIMKQRETHPVVKFYIDRELIDLQDECMNLLLDGPIPPIDSPNRRNLWIYGRFERDQISSTLALKYLAPLLKDPKRRSEWLRDHILAAG